MKIRKHLFLFLLGISAIWGCEEDKKADFTPQEVRQESAQLNQFFESEFLKDLEESPMLQTRLGIKTDYGDWDDYSHLKYAEDLKKAKKRLSYLKKEVRPEALDEDSYLSYRLYKQELEDEIEDYKFRFYNYPVNQMFGVHAALPAFLINMHKIDSVTDAEAYIARLEKFPKVFDDVIKGLEVREMNQIIPPRFVFDHTIEASRNLITGKPFEKSLEASVLLADFKEKVDQLDISEKRKSELIVKAQEALLNSVKPAYEQLIAALVDQQQRATPQHGVWKFPKGKDFYNTALKRTTTTDLSA